MLEHCDKFLAEGKLLNFVILQNIESEGILLILQRVFFKAKHLVEDGMLTLVSSGSLE